MHYPHCDQDYIVVNYTPGGNHPRLLVVHIMEGNMTGTDQWFRNPVSQVSAHFGIALDGYVRQWVDTSDTAWHAAMANDHSIGVELEGSSGQPATDSQLLALSRLFTWAHEEYPAIRGWLTTRPYSGSGLAWHGLGGTSWGGHPDCPGAPIVHQLSAVLLHAASEIVREPLA